MTVPSDAQYDALAAETGDTREWVMAQKWEDILFAHYRYEPSALRALVPSQLEIQVRDGAAWVSVVALRMAHLRLRIAKYLPLLEPFPELNLRTYVTFEGKPGVWFFRIEASSRLAVDIARDVFFAPYVHAQLSMADKTTPTVFTCGANACIASLEYAGEGEPISLPPGSLELFLTERYSLYTVHDTTGQLYCGDIHHSPWTLRHANATVVANPFVTAAGLPVPDGPPTVLASSGTSTVVWWPEKV